MFHFLRFRPSRVGLAAAAGLVLAFGQASFADKVRLPVIGSTVNPTGFTPNNAATPAPNAVLPIVFSLSNTQEDQMEDFIAQQQNPASPNYHHWLTPEEIGQKFGAPDDDINAVVAFAKSQGFTVTHIWPNRMFVSATSTVAQTEAAFGMKLQGYNRPATLIAKGERPTFFAPKTAPTVPVAVAGRLNAVYGMSNFITMHPRLAPQVLSRASLSRFLLPSLPAPVSVKQARGTTPSPTFGGPTILSGPLTPAQLSKVYDTDALHNAGLNGQGMTIGIYAPTNFDKTNADVFAAKYGISGYTITETKIDGGSNDPVPNGGGDVEADLDVQVAIGQANKAHIIMYEHDFGGPESVFLDTYNQVAADNTPIFSMSYGYYENALDLYGAQALTPQLLIDSNKLFAQMFAQGINVFVASGDSGSDPVYYGVLDTSFPTTSPYVVSVGGADRLAGDSTGAWGDEQGWDYGGGGLSSYFNRKSFQVGPNVTNAYSNGFRQEPDVAAQAGFSPTYMIYDKNFGGYFGVAGTSAACPLWATSSLLMTQGNGKVFGPLTPLLYGIAVRANNPVPPPSPFHDIKRIDGSSSGSNGDYTVNYLYHATPNWDYVTGLGSADFGKLYPILEQTAPISLNFAPGEAALGATSTGTVSLGQKATKNTQVFLISDTPSFIVPSSVTVAAGQSSQTFTAQFPARTTKYFATVTAFDGTNVAQAGLLATPIRLFTLTLGTNSVIGGNAVPVTLTLNGPAPKGGVTVFLGGYTYDANGYYVNNGTPIPRSIFIKEGLTSLTFNLPTNGVPNDATAPYTTYLTASYGGVTRGAYLSVTPASLLNLTLAPNPVKGGISVIGTVTLDGSAPAAGASVTLTSSNPQAAVIQTTQPNTVTVLGNESLTTFSIGTKPVQQPTTVVITAAYAGGSKQVFLTINP